MNDNFYHVFNRGVEKRTVFIDHADYKRFLRTLFYYQYQGPKPRFSKFNPLIHKNLSTDKIVDIVSFCLMPNHFHLLLKQNKDNGISEFLRKVSNSYTKYFNIRYKRVGFLFQGMFKAILIESDEQLLHLSRYIHLNPLVANLINDLSDYPWSSYPDYFSSTNPYIEKKYILNFFNSTQKYREFVKDQQDYAKTLHLIKHFILED